MSEKNEIILEEYLLDKRKELMWALGTQGYNDAQIGRIFGLGRTRAHVIMRQRPVTWISPWKKVRP